MLAFILALTMTPPICPMTIGIGQDGTLFSDRFQGWYRVSPKTLESDLRGGCYNDSNPIPVTSIELLLSPNAPKSRVDFVISILEKEGWNRKKIKLQFWRGYPRAPY